MNECKFWPAWRNQCKHPCEGDYCEKHAKVKCSSCGAQAVTECGHTGQFVCGAPLCANCEGRTDSSQGFGSWGFTGHAHRPKESA